MGGLLRRWIITFLAILLVSLVLPNLISYSDLTAAALFAGVLALLYAFIRPVLLVITLPISVITLGLFVVVVNGFLFWLAAAICPGVRVGGFWGALLAALLVGIIGYVVNRVID